MEKKIEDFLLESTEENLAIFLSNVGEDLMWSAKSEIS